MLRCLPFVLLASCATATPHFKGVSPTRVDIDGSLFDVRVRGNLAEAVRVNGQYAPRLGPIRQRAGMAMAQVSGCEVLDVLGDSAVTTGILGCDRATGEKLLQIARSTPNYDCIEVAGPYYTDFECYPY